MSHGVAAHRDDALGDQRVIIGRAQHHHVASRDEVEPHAHPIEEHKVAHLAAGAAVVLARGGGRAAQWRLRARSQRVDCAAWVGRLLAHESWLH